ncbi:MAG: hypothetical protein K8V75_04300 [Methanobrevibacter woesei]|nr:hypothetical protein [Methanobrevibacter woesei]
MNGLNCKSCIYNQNEDEKLNCNRVKCCFLNDKTKQCIISDLDIKKMKWEELKHGLS